MSVKNFVGGFLIVQSITLTGGAIGFAYADDYGLNFFYGCTAVAFVFGILFTVLINRKYPIEDWWEDPSRSRDLDNFQEKQYGKNTDSDDK